MIINNQGQILQFSLTLRKKDKIDKTDLGLRVSRPYTYKSLHVPVKYYYLY